MFGVLHFMWFYNPWKLVLRLGIKCMKVCIFVVVIVIVVVDAKQPKKCFYNWSMVNNARDFSTCCLYGGLTIIHGDVMVFFFFLTSVMLWLGIIIPYQG